MKAILISIKPKWVAKILNGEKIYEIRKTMPKCDLPLPVYIYCSKGQPMIIKHCETTNQVYNGKVVAKFTLNKVEEIRSLMCGDFYHKDICLTTHELNNYLGHRGYGYAWRIDDLEIFDKPKDLHEFVACEYCKPVWKPIGKAPQSWCYVEVVE